MIPFPDISPNIISFSLGGNEFAIRWYAVSYIMGFIVAGFLMKYFIRRNDLWLYGTPPMDKDQSDSFLTILILGVIIGGRLGYVFFYNLNFYIANPFDIFRVWDGGMSFHGGFLGVVLAVVYYCRFNGIPLWSCSDMIAMASPPGLFFGRVANFINAELWGKPTEAPWGVVFPGIQAQNCPEIIGLCARHPSQLYEAVLEGLLLFILMLIVSIKGGLKRPGLISGIFFAGYGISRFFVEFFRVADAQFISLENPRGYVYQLGELGVTMGQLLSLPMLLLGLVFILFNIGRKVN